MRLTDSTEIKLLANGFVAVFEGTGVATLVAPADQFTCGDLYEVYPTFTLDPNYDGDWFPESLSDTIQSCEAVRVGFDNGSACVAGHIHFTDAEYYTREEVKHNIEAGYSLAANARII